MKGDKQNSGGAALKIIFSNETKGPKAVVRFYFTCRKMTSLNIRLMH